MALALADRVLEQSSTAGTGTVSLSGAVAGYKSFANGVGDGQTCYYTIYDPTAFTWEVGIGTYTLSGSTLSRTTVLSNSLNTTALISFAANAKNVFVTYPASKGVFLDSTLGNDTVINTVRVGLGGGSVSSNTAVGLNALVATASGIGNSAFANNALRFTTTGANNTALGAASLYANTTGGSNTSIGVNSQSSNISGGSNVSAGVNSLSVNTTSSNLTAIGTGALQNNTTNVATLGTITGGTLYTTGTYTGVVMTLSSGSTAITYPTATIVVAGGAVTTVTITSAGVGFKDTTTVLTAPAASIGGTGSGFSVPVATLQSGIGNTAIGYQALLNNIVGSSSTAIGYQAALNNSSGTTAVGYRAVATATNGNNTGIGYSALTTATGAGNTAIGVSSGSQITSGANNVVIGSYTGAAAPISSTGSNFIVLSDGAGNVRQTIDASGITSLGGLPGAESFRVIPVASAVNWAQVSGAVAGGGIVLATQGSDTNIPFNIAGKGTGAVVLYANTGLVASFVNNTALSVNYSQFYGSPTGNSITYTASGADANIGMILAPKGTGGLSVTTGGGQQLFVASTASAVNYIQVAGNVTTAAPVVSAKGSDTNIDLLLVPKGTGTVTASGTSAIKIPVGTTAQQPTGASGFIRMNTTTGNPEWWDATTSTWLQFSQPAGYSVNYLVVAGGGGGGTTYGGGGGGGGVLASSVNLSSGTAYTITVGLGGAGSTTSAPGANGGNSAINATVTALGGGGGGSNTGAGSVGGSGGGGSDNGSTFGSGGVGTSGQGFAGGTNNSSPGGGGGGGAGAVGIANGNGGSGLANSISGTAVYYGGGGGGFSTGTGGLGGGGAYSTNGTANSGGGGGANNAGGSGIVIIAYLGSQRGTGGTVTSSGGYTVHTFTSSSTYNA